MDSLAGLFSLSFLQGAPVGLALLVAAKMRRERMLVQRWLPVLVAGVLVSAGARGVLVWPGSEAGWSGLLSSVLAGLASGAVLFSMSLPVVMYLALESSWLRWYSDAGVMVGVLALGQGTQAVLGESVISWNMELVIAIVLGVVALSMFRSLMRQVWRTTMLVGVVAVIVLGCVIALGGALPAVVRGAF